MNMIVLTAYMMIVSLIHLNHNGSITIAKKVNCGKSDTTKVKKVRQGRKDTIRVKRAKKKLNEREQTELKTVKTQRRVGDTEKERRRSYLIQYENDCVACGKPCVSYCRYKNVPHSYCDKCEDEVSELYEYDGEQLCESCLLETVPKVEV